MRSSNSSDSDEHSSEAHTYFRGVYPCGKRWKAQIHFEGSQHYLGTYETPEEAAQAYDDAARAHHGERGKTNYDRSGELTDAIKRRRARPRQLKRSPKPVPAAPQGYSMSVLGKRPLDVMTQPSSHSLLSRSFTKHPASPDSIIVDAFSVGEQYREQIACLMDNRAYLESAIHQRPPTSQTEQLMDEYVVCTIRLDDLMRKLRRVESQEGAACATNLISSETRSDCVAVDARAPSTIAGPLPVPPRFPFGPSVVPLMAGGAGFYAGVNSR